MRLMYSLYILPRRAARYSLTRLAKYSLYCLLNSINSSHFFPDDPAAAASSETRHFTCGLAAPVAQPTVPVPLPVPLPAPLHLLMHHNQFPPLPTRDGHPTQHSTARQRHHHPPFHHNRRSHSSPIKASQQPFKLLLLLLPYPQHA